MSKYKFSDYDKFWLRLNIMCNEYNKCQNIDNQQEIKKLVKKYYKSNCLLGGNNNISKNKFIGNEIDSIKDNTDNLKNIKKCTEHE